LYVDGQDVVTGTTTITSTQGLSITIGRPGPTLPGGYFDGLIDEVVLYGRALSAEQIRAIARPAAGGVAGLEVRLRHVKEGSGDLLPWYPVTLDQPGAAFSTWSYQLPAGLEGPHQIDLRATDRFSHVNVLLDAWTGEIDTLAPRVELRVGLYYRGYGPDFTSYKCFATDYNLTDRNFLCPVGFSPAYQDAAWFTGWFSQTKLYQYYSPHWGWLRDEDGPYSLTACDLFDNCSTTDPVAVAAAMGRVAVEQTALDGAAAAQTTLGTAIWTPAPQSVFTPTQPITIEGYAYALNNLRALTVTVDTAPISTTTWAGSITTTLWSTTWTPAVEGAYNVGALVSDGVGDVQTDTTFSLVPIIVDVTPPELSLSTDSVNDSNFDDAGFVTLSGLVSDTVGLGRLQVKLTNRMTGPDRGWEEAIIPTSPAPQEQTGTVPITYYAFSTPVYAGSNLPPAGETFTLTARVTDLAGHVVEVSRAVWADAVPPASVTATLTYSDSLGARAVITPGLSIRDVSSPTLFIDWTASSDSGSGIARYLVGWTPTPTLSAEQIGNLSNYAAAGSHAQTVGEAQRLYAHVVVEDNAGNQTLQTLGPVYADYPLTPDYVGPIDDLLSYRGWMESGCSLAGVDRRRMQSALGGGLLNVAQRLYLTWNKESLRLAWTGGDWDTDGDLFIYLDTQPGGTSVAYNPYTATLTNTLLYLPGVTPTSVQTDAMQADYLVWVEDSETAWLLRWGGSDWITQTALSSAQYRFDRSLIDPTVNAGRAGQTDLYLLFDQIGVTDPVSTTMNLLAFASEEQALRMWAILPNANPLNSDSVIQTAPYAGDQHTFALDHRYHWDTLSPGLCPNGNDPDTDLRVGLTAGPSGTAYRFLGNDLFWLWSTLLGDRPADVSQGFAFVDNDHPPVGDGQAISYTLHYRNQGQDTASGVRADISALYALRLPDGDLPDLTHQTLLLGDVAPGEEVSATFRGAIAVPADCSTTPSDACHWAAVEVKVYDDAHPEDGNGSGPPLEWAWVDHQVDSQAPEFFGVLRPEFLLAAGSNTLRGYAYDVASVPTLTLEVQAPVGGTSSLICPDTTPEDGRWSCAWDTSATNGGVAPDDGDTFTLRLQATDAFGQASELANEQPVTFTVDTTPPMVTLIMTASQVTTQTNLLRDSAFTLIGHVSDNRGLGDVEVCIQDSQGENKSCAPARLQLEPGPARIYYDDVPGAPLALDGTTTCGGGNEIVRTLAVTEIFPIGEVSVGLNITHTLRDDLQVELVSPAGTRVRVIDGEGGSFSSGQNYDLLLNDAVESELHNRRDDDPREPYYDRQARPYQPLRAFLGEDALGDWTLTICDDDPTQHDGTYNRSRLVLKPQDTAARAGRWFYRGSAVEEGDYVEHVVSIHGADLVGNRAEPLTLTFAVDTVAPAITVTTQPSGIVVIGNPFRLEGTVSDGGQVRVMRLSVLAPNGDTLADTIDHGPSAGSGQGGGTWVYTDTSRFVISGTFTLFVEAQDEAGNQSTVGPFELTMVAPPEPLRVYLPLVLRNYSPPPTAPDLMVETVVLTNTVAEIEIANTGTGDATGGFRVDLYFDPDPAPAPNVRWDDVSTYGGYWLVSTPLTPGQSISLTLDNAAGSNYPAQLDGIFDAYVQVDTFDEVSEMHDISDDYLSNNLVVIRVSEPLAPDLVVTNWVVTATTAEIAVFNSGSVSVTNGFRVDLYFDPNPIPTMASQTWADLSTFGGYWALSGAAVPIAPGQAITLTLNDAYYQAAGSNYPTGSQFGGITATYIQVDTLDEVLETHEIRGTDYNNIAPGEGE
ncbi:MAG: proprotein convertase P-domain-containing protein, partial [Anaerolineae bacterium]